MTYERVVPRDLFNESKLLKCLGKLSIAVNSQAFSPVKVAEKFDGEKFDVQMDPSSGDLFCKNYSLIVGKAKLTFYAPLNSGHAWPLYFGEIEVLDEQGSVTAEFINCVRRLAQ